MLVFEGEITTLQAGDVIIFSLKTKVMKVTRRDARGLPCLLRWQKANCYADSGYFLDLVRTKFDFVGLCQFLGRILNLGVTIEVPPKLEGYRKQVWRATFSASNP